VSPSPRAAERGRMDTSRRGGEWVIFDPTFSAVRRVLRPALG
jgi:hypothetical protein